MEKVRDIDVTWHIMSLAYLNQDKDIPEDYRALLADAWGPVRVCMAAEQQHGKDALLPLYTALGTRLHDEGQKQSRELVADALAEAGLPASLADAMDDPSYDEDIKKSHHLGMDQVGQEVGTPDHRLRGHGVLRPGDDLDPAGRGGRADLGRGGRAGPAPVLLRAQAHAQPAARLQLRPGRTVGRERLMSRSLSHLHRW